MLRLFMIADRVQEDDIGAHINVGRTYTSLQMYDKAEQAYRTVSWPRSALITQVLGSVGESLMSVVGSLQSTAVCL